jgi:hypothetical protein
MTPSAPPAALTAAGVSARIQQAVSDTFLRSTAENGHDPGKLSMSGLGGCTRKAAYQLAGHAPTNTAPAEKRAADLGTAIHEWLLPRLARTLGGHWTRVEHAATLTTPHGRIHGTLDLETLAYADPSAMAASDDTPEGSTLVDAKTVARWKFDRILASREIQTEHLFQTLGYGVARGQAGHPVRWVNVLYICRDTGRSLPLTFELTDDYVNLLFSRIELLHRYAAHPGFAPREERGPGLSVVCDGCPFLARCWGPDARPGVTGAQKTAVVTDADVVRAAAALQEATAARLAWERMEDFWKLVLAERRGTFTDGARTAVIGERGGARRRDQTAMAAILAARGIEVPYAQNQPSLTVSVREEPSAP